MKKMYIGITFLACIFTVVFVGRAFAEGNFLKPGEKKVSIFMDILSPDQIVLPEQITSLPGVVQDLIDYLAVNTQTAEEIKDNMALWATKQKSRMLRWRAHTMEN